MERKDWCLRVYKADRRYAAGERKVAEYRYSDCTHADMTAEVADLRSVLYRPVDGWRLEFEPSKTMVRNIMTGKEVEIRTVDRGTCLDPSTETYWCM